MTLALGVAAVGCELIARSVFEAPPNPAREPPILFQSDPDLGFVHVPNQQGWLDDGFSTINALGLRGPVPRMPKPPATFRVLAVGDSTTFGWGVDDDGTYCAHLERMLRAEYPDRDVEVINGGVSAYDLQQEARLLRRFAPKFQPDIVLVGLYWNDVAAAEGAPDDQLPHGKGQSSITPAQGGSTKPFHIGSRPSGLNRILRQSRALYVLRQWWLRMLTPTSQATNLVRWEMALLEGRQTPAIAAGWRDIAGTLSEIRDLGRQGGFSVGVLIVPIRAQVEEQHPHAQYQTRVREIAESLGLFVIDPLPRLIDQPDHRRLFIPYDRIHLTSLGNAQVATVAFDTLRRRPELAGFHPD